MAILSLNSGKSLWIEGSVKETMMRLLVEATAELNRPLTFAEASKNPNLPHPNSYAYYYGEFREAAKTAYGRILRSRPLSEPSLPEPPTPVDSPATPQPAHPKGGTSMKHRRRRWTPADLISVLRTYYETHNNTLPDFKTVRDDPSLPSYTTLVAHLGPRDIWLAQIFPEERNLVAEEASVMTEDAPEESVAPEEPAPRNLVAEISTSEEVDVVEADASENADDGSTTIELKLNIPGHARPVLLTVTF